MHAVRGMTGRYAAGPSAACPVVGRPELLVERRPQLDAERPDCGQALLWQQIVQIGVGCHPVNLMSQQIRPADRSTLEPPADAALQASPDVCSGPEVKAVNKENGAFVGRASREQAQAVFHSVN
jgi:hypothetical protein